MNILVGYIPTPEGVAAVDWAIAEAQQRQASLTVLNTGKNGDYSNPQFATSEDIDALEVFTRPGTQGAPVELGDLLAHGHPHGNSPFEGGVGEGRGHHGREAGSHSIGESGPRVGLVDDHGNSTPRSG